MKSEVLVIITVLRTIFLCANTANHKKRAFKQIFPPHFISLLRKILSSYIQFQKTKAKILETTPEA